MYIAGQLLPLEHSIEHKGHVFAKGTMGVVTLLPENGTEVPYLVVTDVGFSPLRVLLHCADRSMNG